MKNTKRLTAFLASALLLASLVSCGNNSSDTSSTDVSRGSSSSAAERNETETVSGDMLPACKMTVWLAGSGEQLYNDVYNGIIDKWIEERAPGSSNELSIISWTDYFSKLSTGLAGGAAPDVYMTGYGQMGSMYAQGYELNLSEYIPEDWDGYTDIPENILNTGMVDGELYGLMEPSTRVIAYRKDIAEQNGVTEEDLILNSLEDLTNLVQKMCVYDDSGNLVMAGWDLQTGTSSSEQTIQFIASNFMDNYELWDDNGMAAFNNEATKQAFIYLKGLFDAGYCFPSDASNTTLGIITGLSSMSLLPETMYTQADMAFPGQIGYTKMNLNTMLSGNFMVVNSNTQNPQQATDLLLYMFNQESMKSKASMGQYTLRTSLNDWYVETYPELENVVTAYSKSYAMADTLNANYNECIQVLRNHYEAYMNGIEDLDTALSAAESEWNAIVGG